MTDGAEAKVKAPRALGAGALLQSEGTNSAVLLAEAHKMEGQRGKAAVKQMHHDEDSRT